MTVGLRAGLEGISRVLVYAVLLIAPLARGGRPLWAAAAVETLALLAVLVWVLHMLRARRLEWRQTALDWPLTLFLVLVLLQMVLGNTSLAAWALGPPSTAGDGLPAPFLTIGTIAPGVTLGSAVLLLAYIAVYVVVVNVFRRRRQIEALVRAIVVFGSALAIVALVDYFTYDVVRWRDGPRRAVATFVNADHFAAWINMVLFLALGYLLARGWEGSRRERFETLGRRYTVLGALVVLLLALVFTLSRGAIASFAVASAVVLVLAAATGLARRTFIGVGLLLVVALGYAAWLGVGPLLARLHEGQTVAQRIAIYRSALHLFTDFPVLGIGLGTYPEISSRYQDRALGIGEQWLNAAHSDWLQILVETGVIGLGLALYAVVRVGRDLIGVHLTGRGACPVDGGEGEWGRRHDSFSVGLSLGALGAVVSLLVHSLVDFSARMAANGVLAAACLGIATVALHTRFGTEDGYLATRRACDIRRTSLARLGAAAACLAVLGLSAVAIRPATVEALLATSPALQDRRIETLLTTVGAEPRALLARAERKHAVAYEISTVGTVGGQPVGGLDDRRVAASRLLDEAIHHLRQALEALPSSALLHERLAWTHQLYAQIDPAHSATHAAAGVAHMNRAIALADENALPHKALAELVVNVQPHAPIEVGLTAARNAVQRRPELLPDLVYAYLLLPLDDAQWLRLVPATFEDRLILGDLLERRRRDREATAVYRRATDVAHPADAALARYMVARSLMRQSDHPGALRELGAAMQVYPDNPDLHLAAAESLDVLREPVALEMYRTALAKAEDRVQRAKSASAFAGYGGRLGELAARHAPIDTAAPLAPYRRGLARYLAQRELWRQALQQSEALIAELPRDATAHFVKGQALEALNRPDEAVEAYGNAVASEANNPAIRLRLARLLIHMKQPFQAIHQWNAVLATDPGNLEAALGIARAHLERGAHLEAFRAYQQVLAIAPDNAEARRVLIRFGWTPR